MAEVFCGAIRMSRSNCYHSGVSFLETRRPGEHFLLLQRVSIACYAERCISHSKSVRPSVRLSVRHTLALSQNDSSYDHGFFTGG